MTQIIDLGKLRFHFASDFVPETVYEINDIVRYGGNVYAYIYALKTAGNLPTNLVYWALMVEGSRFMGTFSAGTAYLIGESVSFGANLYVATADTTGNLPTDATKWLLYVGGLSNMGTWQVGTAYLPNQVVQYGGSAYRAKSTVAAGIVPTNTASWEILVTGMRNLGAWATSAAYLANDLVTFGGNSYQCLIPHASAAFADDLSAGRWQKFNSGIRWRGQWAAGTAYLTDDVIYDGTHALIALSSFTSGTTSSIADGISPTAGAKWGYLAKGAYGIPTPTSATIGHTLSNDGATPVWKAYPLRGLFAATQV